MASITAPAAETRMAKMFCSVPAGFNMVAPAVKGAPKFPKSSRSPDGASMTLTREGYELLVGSKMRVKSLPARSYLTT